MHDKLQTDQTKSALKKKKNKKQRHVCLSKKKQKKNNQSCYIIKIAFDYKVCVFFFLAHLKKNLDVFFTPTENGDLSHIAKKKKKRVWSKNHNQVMFIISG